MGQRPMALQTSMLAEAAEDGLADGQPPPPLGPSKSVGTIPFLPPMASVAANQPAHARSRSSSPAPATKVQLCPPWPA
jgi:hypothetical protein